MKIYVVIYLHAGLLWNIAAHRNKKQPKKLYREWKKEASDEDDGLLEEIELL